MDRTTGPIDGQRAMAHVCELVSFRPRHSGTEGARRSAHYIHDTILELGVQVRIQQWRDPQADGATLRNIIADIPGEDPEKGPVIAFGSHYDAKRTHGADLPREFDFEGAIDGGGSNGVLIELIRAAKDRKNKANLRFLFFDAEESRVWNWVSDKALLGSKHYVQKLGNEQRSRIKAFVLLDLVGDKDMKFDKDGKSNPRLHAIFLEAAVEMGAEDRVYKYSSSFTDDHESFMRFGIPAMVLIDFKYRIPLKDGGEPSPPGTSFQRWWHTEHDTLDKMSPDSLAFAGNLVWTALPRLESSVF